MPSARDYTCAVRVPDSSASGDEQLSKSDDETNVSGKYILSVAKMDYSKFLIDIISSTLSLIYSTMTVHLFIAVVNIHVYTSAV